MSAALDRFFAHGGAGRAGADFVTSPEVGSLFGALVARALDDWWDRLGSPDPFVVVDAGAGRGQLARDVLRAEPRCRAALRYVMVERSATLRGEQRARLPVEPWEDALGPFLASDDDAAPRPIPGVGPIVTALDELPATAFDGVVVANELLDNLPFDVVERTETGWSEVRVGLDDERFVEVTVPAPPGLDPAFDVEVGARVPRQQAIESWLASVALVLRRGAVIVIDYAAPAAEVAARGQAGWLRTYRSHARGGPPLEGPGTQDVTTDVVLETVRRGARRAGLDVASETSQGAWLHDLGVEQLMAAARAHWHDRAHVGDLDALAARSRVAEAAALTDPSGLGAHRVVVLTKGL